MVRDANIHDAPQILALLRREMTRYPLKEDRRSAMVHLRHLLTAKQHFAQVHITDDKVLDGVLLAYTSDMIWAQRKSSEVLAWVAHTPMTGVAMFSNYSTWLLQRPGIKRAVVVSDHEDYNLRGLRVFGFIRQGDVYMRYR